MPRKKSDYAPLTMKEILKVNPDRKNLIGTKKEFNRLLNKALNSLPFDKKKHKV